MPLQITLVRHGRSAHVESGWLDPAGLRRWYDAYDAAGIAEEDAPPPALVALAREAGLVVASDLPRAVASAARLAPDAPLVTVPLLRESTLALPAGWPGVRLPLAGWALVAGVRQGVQALRGTPAPQTELRRATQAASWLTELATTHERVVAVTHATFRGLVAQALVADGWRGVGRGEGRGGTMARWRHWSAWTFTAPARAGRAPSRTPATTLETVAISPLVAPLVSEPLPPGVPDEERASRS